MPDPLTDAELADIMVALADPITPAWLRESVRRVVADLDRLRADNAALRRQVAGHGERIAAQSALLARRAEWTPILSDPDAAAPDPPLPRGPAGG